MIYASLKTLHVPSIVVWIGGMVFAHLVVAGAGVRSLAELGLL